MLKKVLALLLSCFIITGLFVFNNSPIFKNYADEYEVYLTDFSCSNKIISVDKNKYSFILGIKGESVVIEKADFCLQSFLTDFNARVVLVESAENYTCYYAYSPNIKSSRQINDKAVNLHIALTDQRVKVGSPIIYGSF